nr:MAG TPA: hypothetical protein [Caudoviricetes sp.]
MRCSSVSSVPSSGTAPWPTSAAHLLGIPR